MQHMSQKYSVYHKHTHIFALHKEMYQPAIPRHRTLQPWAGQVLPQLHPSIEPMGVGVSWVRTVPLTVQNIPQSKMQHHVHKQYFQQALWQRPTQAHKTILWSHPQTILSTNALTKAHIYTKDNVNVCQCPPKTTSIFDHVHQQHFWQMLWKRPTIALKMMPMFDHIHRQFFQQTLWQRPTLTPT